MTLTFVVAAGGAPVTNYDLTLDWDHAKATLDPATGITGLAFADGNYDGNTLIVSSAQTAAINPGGTVLTLRFTLVNGTTTLPLTYAGTFNADSTPLALTGVQAANGSVTANAPATGDVTVTGTLTEDQTLTAVTTTIADGDGLGTFSYQWLRDGANITTNGTGSTYTLTDADVGKKITVKVSFTDGHGVVETKTSATPANNVAGVNDAPTGGISITGNNAKGAVLSIANNTIADADGLGTLNYQWFANNVAITSNATGNTTYTLTANEVGKDVKLVVTYTDGQGFSNTVTSNVIAQVVDDHLPTGQFNFTPGAIFEDQLLVLNDTLTDADGIATRAYSWYRADDQSGTNKQLINGASSGSYRMTQADVGKFVSASVTITDSLGNVKTVDSNQLGAAVGNVNDQPTGGVTVANTSRPGQPPQQGDTLTATNTIADEDGIPTTGANAITIHWFAGSSGTAFAAGNTVVLGQSQVGQTITAKAVYTDNFNNQHTVTGTPTAAVLNVNDDPVGTVTVTGAYTQGQTLTATDNVTDVDGIPGTGTGAKTYHWFAGATEITRAAGSNTLLLTQDEVTKVITAKVVYTDQQGATETVTSATPGQSVGNINDAPVNALSINGSLAKGATISVGGTVTDADGIPANGITYTWLADNVQVGTGTSYVLQAAEIGKQIKLVASYTDNFGQQESVSVNGSAAVRDNAAATGTVSVAGTAAQNQTLTVSSALRDADNANPNVDVPAGSITYQWFKQDGANTPEAIQGATGTSLALNQSLVGYKVFARASFTDGLGVVENVNSAATAIVANVNEPLQGAVTIDGTVREDATLTANTSALSDPDGNLTFTYKWFAGADEIVGQTNQTLVLGQAQVGKTVRVEVSATDHAFNSTPNTEVRSATTATAVANVNDTPVGAVTVTGTYTQGQVLTVSDNITDEDGIPTTGANAKTYHWFAGATEITRAVGQNSLTLTQDEVTKVITAKVVYTDQQGATETVTSATPAQSVGNINDAPVNNLTIVGSLAKGATISVGGTVTDADGIPANGITYTWLADNVQVGTGTSYTLKPAELGKQIKLVASYTDNFGQQESVSVNGSAAVRDNAAATGTVTVAGTAAQNQTLTVSSALRDADNANPNVDVPAGSITYQWFKQDGANPAEAIQGATGTSLALNQALVGYKVFARASFTDGLGVVENVNSAATAIVANVNDALQGAVTITGDAREDATLTANTDALSDPDGNLTFTYKWFANGTQVAGQTNKTLVLGQAQVGKTVTVEVTATDHPFAGTGNTPVTNSEVRTAATATTVANVNDVMQGLPTITGQLAQNQTLQASTAGLTDEDGLPTSFAYQWYANNVAISGATAASYKLTQAEVNKAISVKVTGTDQLGSVETATSAASSAVANVDDDPTGVATIDGALVAGMPLKVNTSRLFDLDNLTVAEPRGAIPTSGTGSPTYQWYSVDGANETLIGNQTTSSFTPDATYKDKLIKVVGTFVDAYGATETFTATTTSKIFSEADVKSATGVAGDGNGDGIQDDVQAAVVSAPFVVSAPNAPPVPVFVTLVANADANGKPVTDGATSQTGATITTINQETPAEAAPDLSVAPPPKMDLPLGIIDFTATTTKVATPETFTLYVSATVNINGYWKLDPVAKTWVNLASVPYGGSLTKVGSGTDAKWKVVFQITDNDGKFDSDPTVGIIQDPGCIAALPLSVVGYAPDVVLTANTHFFF